MRSDPFVHPREIARSMAAFQLPAYFAALALLMAPVALAQKKAGDNAGSDTGKAKKGQVEVQDGGEGKEEVVEEEEEEEEVEEEEDGSEGGDGGAGSSDIPKSKGRLVIEVIDEDEVPVFVNGANVGETPWKDDVFPGKYKIGTSVPGIWSWKGKVEVAKGKVTTVTVDPQGDKMVPATSKLFWGLLAASIPTLTAGAILAGYWSSYLSRSDRLLKNLNGGIYAADPILQAEKGQQQIDLANFSNGLRTGTIVAFAFGGVLAAGTVASLFIFRKKSDKKKAAEATIVISTASPLADPSTGAIGLQLSGIF